jgi:ATP-dependent helicase/DNAse subunit B
VRVIDYKAGSTPITRDDAFRGRNIQLPLYALAVERSIMPGSKVVSGQYLSVSSGEPSGRLSFEPEVPAGSSSPGGETAGSLGARASRPLREALEQLDLKKVAEEHVRNFVHGIESGDYSVRPNGKSVCKSCIHRPICRVGELAETLGEGASEL